LQVVVGGDGEWAVVVMAVIMVVASGHGECVVVVVVVGDGWW
jgi:hypothetical protein